MGPKCMSRLNTFNFFKSHYLNRVWLRNAGCISPNRQNFNEKPFSRYEIKKYCLLDVNILKNNFYNKSFSFQTAVIRHQSTSSNSTDEPKPSNATKLKKALAEYGTTVIVFHVTISIVSLGLMYLLVSSGVDVVKLLSALGISQDGKLAEIASNAGTFVIAYAVHKVFAPARITITLAATPFIVRHLRRIGILKTSKVNTKVEK
ncbi:protein FAM210B, mitochondrial-like [Agrilus planipennis]|uniref:Protein FAM210B, mitochondrial-like n=1 Tax=Agrilus planipennis TaxID=224129 RepID=A0A1W4XQN7_AGRPL|nr:protein FAM210B, mitochondrial-like [Agrilus planipennis]